ncbi:HET domain-containing protein [Colletotrichum simmondsii]|uniref:HET domain-containing protein n=1 Tax=Colletotrichum simmondsii TaxID=703756 RepID=A0A135TFT8_9PEZI|nr:HET domain-containing protein [Colletotrichum simmondsii]
MEVTPAQRPQSLPSYRYEPLKHPDSTRVLVLQPAVSFKSQLRCSMIQYSRQEQLRSRDTSRNYSAVSYAWGLPDFSVDLVIHQRSVRDDITTPKRSLLKITPTVDSMLRYLRDTHELLYLWIDALCIDQQDENDKAVQIPQMGDIYKCAETVHVWLGDVHAAEVAVAFNYIRMAHQFSKATEPSRMGLCNSLTMLTQMPWFSRRWVIQEIKLADRAVLHYGAYSVEYAHFRAAWYLAESRMLSRGNLGYLRHLLRRDTTDDFLELLWEFHTAMCSDPRDRLAALYCILPQSEQQIDLQYGQIGWKEMYRRLAEKYINKGTLSASRVILHLFAFGPAAGRSLDDAECPSWVPDWSGVRQLGMASGEFHMDRLHPTDRGDKPWMDCTDNSGGLQTEGPFPEPHWNGSLFSKEKEKLWPQEAQQDIPDCRKFSGSRLVRDGFATRFFAEKTKLRVRWSPFRGGLYGKNARLILTLPRELVIEKEKLWKHTLSCLKPIQNQFVTSRSCLRIAALFAIALKGKDAVSEDKDQLSSWSFHTLTEKLYEAVRTGFENPEFLAREQKLLLALLGSILQRFALVVLHPSPYSRYRTIEHDPTRLVPDYGLAPHDMKLGDILIPLDETKQRKFPVDDYCSTGPEFLDSHFAYIGEHLVEVSICLRPMSPKLVHEVSDISQQKLSSPLDKIAAMADGSQETYRHRPDDSEFPYPPSHVRTARFLGPAYCVSKSRDDMSNFDRSKRMYERNLDGREDIWNDYEDACAAGLCRPFNIDIV